mgnify:CR=1 FL=1
MFEVVELERVVCVDTDKLSGRVFKHKSNTFSERSFDSDVRLQVEFAILLVGVNIEFGAIESNGY